MDTPRIPKRRAQLRALAAVLANQPDIPYLALAEKAGVSRRTLYRIAGSKEDLVAVLADAAIAATEAAMSAVDPNAEDVRRQLTILTDAFVEEAELYAFWLTAASADPTANVRVRMAEAIERYHDFMRDYFAAAQRRGVMRSDLEPMWLIRVYDVVIMAAAADRDPMGEGLADRIMSTFLDGAAGPNPKPRHIVSAPDAGRHRAGALAHGR